MRIADSARMLPDIFANGNCDPFAFIFPNFGFLARLKIAPFIEDIVSGKKPFVLKAQKPSICDNCRTIKKRLFFCRRPALLPAERGEDEDKLQVIEEGSGGLCLNFVGKTSLFERVYGAGYGH